MDYKVVFNTAGIIIHATGSKIFKEPEILFNEFNSTVKIVSYFRGEQYTSVYPMNIIKRIEVVIPGHENTKR